MLPTKRGQEETEDAFWSLVLSIFCAVAATFLLYSLHLIASALLLDGRITALREMGEAYTPEERETLIHKIKHGSMQL